MEHPTGGFMSRNKEMPEAKVRLGAVPEQEEKQQVLNDTKEELYEVSQKIEDPFEFRDATQEPDKDVFWNSLTGEVPHIVRFNVPAGTAVQFAPVIEDGRPGEKFNPMEMLDTRHVWRNFGNGTQTLMKYTTANGVTTYEVHSKVPVDVYIGDQRREIGGVKPRPPTIEKKAEPAVDVRKYVEELAPHKFNNEQERQQELKAMDIAKEGLQNDIRKFLEFWNSAKVQQRVADAKDQLDLTDIVRDSGLYSSGIRFSKDARMEQYGRELLRDLNEKLDVKIGDRRFYLRLADTSIDFAELTAPEKVPADSPLRGDLDRNIGTLDGPEAFAESLQAYNSARDNTDRALRDYLDGRLSLLQGYQQFPRIAVLENAVRMEYEWNRTLVRSSFATADDKKSLNAREKMLLINAREARGDRYAAISSVTNQMQYLFLNEEKNPNLGDDLSFWTDRINGMLRMMPLTLDKLDLLTSVFGIRTHDEASNLDKSQVKDLLSGTPVMLRSLRSGNTRYTLTVEKMEMRLEKK